MQVFITIFTDEQVQSTLEANATVPRSGDGLRLGWTRFSSWRGGATSLFERAWGLLRSLCQKPCLWLNCYFNFHPRGTVKPPPPRHLYIGNIKLPSC